MLTGAVALRYTVQMASSRVRWPDPDDDPTLSKSFELLRAKWKQIPVSHRDRRYSHECEAMADDELLSFWRKGAQATSAHHRGWYQTLYRDSFRGKRLIDHGCGLGFDTLLYAQNGAQVTFIDIVESNVNVVKRLAALFGLRGCEFLFLKDLGSLAALSGDYDVIYCCGSMICAPLWVIRKEVQALLQHLPVGGRWMELAYPKARWEREGRFRSKTGALRRTAAHPG
jgi:SAM-dependent methyltransferase